MKEAWHKLDSQYKLYAKSASITSNVFFTMGSPKLLRPFLRFRALSTR